MNKITKKPYLFGTIMRIGYLFKQHNYLEFRNFWNKEIVKNKNIVKNYRETAYEYYKGDIDNE